MSETAAHSGARAALDRYREELLRAVAAKLIRPRQQWSAEDLRDKMLAALDDPVSIDRAIRPVSSHARQLLKLIDLSSQAVWPLQALVDVLPALGCGAGIEPVRELLDAGLMFPVQAGNLPLESFDIWLSQAVTSPLLLTTLPLIAERCRGEALPLDGPTGTKLIKPIASEADGLEWPLRLAVLWQLVRGGSLRMTQAGGYFKRDLDRLRGHPLLSISPADAPAPVIDPAILAVELGRTTGLLILERDELSAVASPPSWRQSLGDALESLWRGLWWAGVWDPLEGYQPDPERRRWLAPLGVLLLAALAQIPAAQWVNVETLAAWLTSRQLEAGKNPGRLIEWCRAILLGLFHSLRIIEHSKSTGGDWIRLTGWARGKTTGTPTALPDAAIPQTLLVQPNLEIVLYRQGLTPGLLAMLTRFAEWKTLGLACTLTLTAESVYRGLESGLSLNDIVRTLERHSTRPLGDSVVETLRSWASKRERVQVYPAAMLLEFRTTADLEIALKQGLVEQRLTDRIGLVSAESRLDYARFRLVGSRDYQAADERCVEVEPDGLTLVVHDGKADLLLGAEVRRFADRIEPTSEDRSRFRASVDTLARGRSLGIDQRWLDDWFIRRSGFPTPATIKLLFLGHAAGQLRTENLTALRLPSSEAADGLERWPAAQPFLIERLGPTTFAVDAGRLDDLTALLIASGLQWKPAAGPAE